METEILSNAELVCKVVRRICRAVSEAEAQCTGAVDDVLGEMARNDELVKKIGELIASDMIAEVHSFVGVSARKDSLMKLLKRFNGSIQTPIENVFSALGGTSDIIVSRGSPKYALLRVKHQIRLPGSEYVFRKRGYRVATPLELLAQMDVVLRFWHSMPTWETMEVWSVFSNARPGEVHAMRYGHSRKQNEWKDGVVIPEHSTVSLRPEIGRLIFAQKI
jgi:hypothetical protein